MTGETIVRRAMAYERDVQEIRLKLALANDVALRITSSAGGISGGGHSDRPLAAAVRKDELERALEARDRCREAELGEAARLIGQIPWVLCGEVMRRTCFSGDSLRQIAAAIRQSEDSVRSLRRRGWNALAGMESALDADARYSADRRAFERIKQEAHDHP